MNLLERFCARASERPSECAILFEGQSLTYGELAASSQKLASALSQVGVTRGERVALWLPNSPAYVVSYIAALRLGAVVVSVAPMLKEREVAHVLADSRPELVITTEGILAGTPVGLELARAGFFSVGSSGHLERLGAHPTAGQEDELLPRSEKGLLDVSADHPAAILYTSGTTGRQKGVVLTHGNLESNLRAVAKAVGARPGDRHMLFLPLFHCFGQNFIMNTTLGTGGTLLLSQRFQLEEVLDLAVRERATHFYAVPTIFIHLIGHTRAVSALSAVRYFFSAAATMPVEVLRNFERTFGKRIHEGYGLTETSPLASYNPDARPGSVGIPIDDVEMKVVDENGLPCPTGQWGEICIRGPNVMAGYYNNPAATAEALREGWFHSGDIGFVDDDGYYFLVDRKKDMINRAGFKVWPSEVEDALYQHPAVRECAVVGVPDEVLGERVRAYITPHEGLAISEEQLAEHLKGLLANYKLPESYVFDETIPKSAAGKILKRLLRETVPASPQAR